MRSILFRQLAWSAVASLVWAATPAQAAELYLAGELGIASLSGEGTGTNDIVGTNTGSSKDASPVYGGALGIVFPLNAALPWRMRIPGFAVPYWPGRQLRFHGGEDVRFPDWGVRVEVEHLRGRGVDLSTSGPNALEPYRSDVESWSVMGKLRMDVPVRAPIYAMVGRVPFLDPLTLYGGGGAGIGVTDLAVGGPALLSGSDHTQEFGWQAVAGIGYQLTDRVKWSLGWRFYDLGEAKTRLVDTALIDRGSYSIDLSAHEFTTSLSFSFWRLPFLGEN